MRSYVIMFTSDGIDTCEVDQPARSAADAVRAVDKAYRHIAQCANAECACHNRAVVNIDGYVVDEPTARHTGPVYYQTVTAHGMLTIRATGYGRHARVEEI